MASRVELLSVALANRYTIRGELGSGGMATVYLAEDLKHHRQVAVKVLHPELTAVLGSERFLREIETVARLNHPHILPLHDSGDVDGFLFYVMPFIDGETLRDRLNREKHLTVDDTIMIAADVGDALDYAHDEGVVHRDVKPENILLNRGYAIVTDFGIAKAISAAGGEQLTETGIVVGTPQYMSPEQASGDAHLSTRSDVYALGVVVYEMLAGSPPFSGSTAQQIMARNALDPVPPLTTARPDVPASVCTAIERSLAKVPAARFDRCTSFVRAMQSRVTEGPKKGGLLRRSAWVVAGAVALGLSWFAFNGGLRQPALVASQNFVAVFPAAVRTPDRDLSEYLEFAIFELLSEALDGAGSLRAVDQNVLGPAFIRMNQTNFDVTQAADVSQSYGAGVYVLSRVTQVGTDLQIVSSLYGTGDTSQVITAQASGPEEDLVELVNEIAWQLVSVLPAGQGAYLEDIRGLTTQSSSYPAIKAYLQGENHKRHRRHDMAVSAFTRAIEADSAFSLAWLRRADVLTFSFGFQDRATMDGTMEHRERFGWRDSLYSEALRDYHVNELDRSIVLADSILRRYPNDVNALTLKGATMIWNNWRRGRSLGEARGPLANAVRLDPGHHANFFLMWVDAIQEHPHQADSAMRSWFGVTEFDELLIVRQAQGILWFGDSAAQDSMIARLVSVDAGQLATIIFLVPSEPALRVARILTSPERLETERLYGFLQLATLEVARGRWNVAREYFDQAATLDRESSTVFRALAAALPFVELDAGELSSLHTAVDETVTDGGSGMGVFTIPDVLRPHVRTYLLGLLDAKRGNLDSALARARDIQQASERIDDCGLLHDLAAEIMASAAMAENNSDRALDAIEAQQYRLCPIAKALNTSFYTRSIGRALRAQFLLEVGRYEEAIGWLEGFGVFFGNETNLYRAHTARQLALANDLLGHEEESLKHWYRFVDLWSQSDKRYEPLLAEGRRRIAELVSESSNSRR